MRLEGVTSKVLRRGRFMKMSWDRQGEGRGWPWVDTLRTHTCFRVYQGRQVRGRALLEKARQL